MTAAALQQHTPLAKTIAWAFMRKLPCTVLREDIEQAAMIGLWDGLQRRPDNAEPGHEWYLRRRIRGAIIDELRTQDWLPRRGRATADRAGPDTVSTVIVRIDDLSPMEAQLVSTEQSIEDRLDIESQYAEAWKAPLKERDKKVIQMTEVRGIKFKDVGRDLGVSEPRISQLHRRSLDVMRAHLTGDTEPEKRWNQITVAMKATLEEEKSHAHHKNDRRIDRAARRRADGPRPAPADAPPVRARGLGIAPAARPARALPGRGRVVQLHGAPPAVLRRARLTVGPAVEPPTEPALPCRALVDHSPELSPVELSPAEPAYIERAGGVSPSAHSPVHSPMSALATTLPEGGLDLRAEVAAHRGHLLALRAAFLEQQGCLVAQAIARSRGDLIAAGALLRLTPIEVARAQARLPALARVENPVMKQPPVAIVKAAPAPTAKRPADDMGRIDGGLLRIDSAVIKRLHVEGYSAKAIGRRLGVNPHFVERVLRMMTNPMTKCGEKPGAP